MNKYFINFAHNGYYDSQRKAILSAQNFRFKVYGYKISDIDEDFKLKNQNIFSYKKGCGYWIWKPYIILQTLKKINYGDFLIYMDSGAFLIKNPYSIMSDIDEKGILAFSTTHLQSAWCKKDLFEYIFKDGYDYSDRPQMLASYIFFKKTDFAIKFIEEWLYISQIEHLITDEQSVSPNYNNFKGHRHDQSVYSLLVYRDRLKITPDISQWRSDFGLDPSGRIIEHHRINK